MSAPDLRTICVGEASAPKLSVLTPFYRHDPCALLAAMGQAPADVEFVLFDDGSADERLVMRTVAILAKMSAPAQLMVSATNCGRSAARNQLIDAARGEYVLFLDADMLPDHPDFLDRWLDVIRRERPVAAFGGLSLKHVTHTSETALHHHLFAVSDCRDADARARAPTQSVASANLLVRRDFMQVHPFDDGFVGWGFEDVDWALTATEHAPILHVDNPASHAGLDDVETLMRKSAEAGPNFARLARKHPRAVARFAAHRVARVMQRTPARTRVRAACAWLARFDAAPMPLRRGALKLYRASHFAEHLS